MDSQLITEQEISREITILKQLKHPNIVEYQDAFQVAFGIFRTMVSFILSRSIVVGVILEIYWTVMRRNRRRRKRRF